MSELAVRPLGLANALQDAAVGSPEWWLRRLHREIVNRQADIAFFDDYYCGRHPLPWLAPQARSEFRRVLQMARANVMGLVVDSIAERLALEGFRLPGEEGADAELWRIWKANNLDEDFDKAILEALICGTSYTLVEPTATDTPNIYIEHASQAIVAYEPGSNRRRRAAGLKVWADDWTGRLHATLYLPDWIYKFEAPKPNGEFRPESLIWNAREIRGETWPVRNTLGEVPLVELPNNPRLLTGGVSELVDVVDIQDRINKTLADRLITQDFGAFPQKWATGYPEEGPNGEPIEPIDIGRDRVVTTDVSAKDAAFGQWESAPLDPYSAAKREDVKDVASRKRMPAQYLLGDMANVNGETLKASESGLVAVVRQKMRPFGGGAVTTMALARKAAGLPVPDARMESLWRNPEFRTEGETTDAAVKQLGSQIRDLRAAREFVGISQTEIAAMEDRESRMDPVAERIAREFQAGAAGAPAAGD